MAKHITVTEVLRNFSEYINRVTYRGEKFILVRGKLKVAELSPAPVGCSAADLQDLFKSLPSLSKAESKKFEGEINAFRKKQAKEKLRDPWE